MIPQREGWYYLQAVDLAFCSPGKRKSNVSVEPCYVFASETGLRFSPKGAGWSAEVEAGTWLGAVPLPDPSGEVGLGPFHYARDHARGPGAWCVAGPRGFSIGLDDKLLAAALGKLLSGAVEEARDLAAEWLKLFGLSWGTAMWPKRDPSAKG